MSLGRNINTRRRALRLSQEELAEKLMVARQTVSSWERDIFMPATDYLIKISKLLNCSTDDLISENPTPPSLQEAGAKTQVEAGAKTGQAVNE